MHTQTLPNGLRILTVPLRDTKAVTIFVFAKVGSRYETKSINGISHFIEHLMFKGTTKRPSTLDISKLLDGVGAQYNAFTSKDWTGYYVKINHEHTDMALDVVSDMLQHSKFDAKEIERERGVIIEEINMYDDNPTMSIDDIFEEIIFGLHHPLGWNIAGPRQVIREVSRASMIKFRDRHYQAKNMWVVVAGRLDPKLDQAITKYFRHVRTRPTVLAAKPYRRGPITPAVKIKYKEVEQIQIGLGVPALKYTDDRLPALQLLSIILGGNMSSRLFIQVRERRGLAYSVRASVNPYEDTGAFMVQAGLDKRRLEPALKVIMAELKKFKTTPVGSVELKRAKEFLRGKMILDLEDSDSIASWYGRQVLFHKKIKTPEQALERMMTVTPADIRRIAKKLFTRQAMRLAVIGPYKTEGNLPQIIRQI